MPYRLARSIQCSNLYDFEFYSVKAEGDGMMWSALCSFCPTISVMKGVVEGVAFPVVPPHTHTLRKPNPPSHTHLANERRVDCKDIQMRDSQDKYTSASPPSLPFFSLLLQRGARPTLEPFLRHNIYFACLSGLVLGLAKTPLNSTDQFSAFWSCW